MNEIKLNEHSIEEVRNSKKNKKIFYKGNLQY